MSLGVYMNFERESEEVIKYYEQVFNVKCDGLVRYKDMPEDPNYPIPSESMELVMNASIVIHGAKVMFSDVDGMGVEYKVGNNISLVVDTKDEAMLTSQFEMLAKEGKVTMPLGETFWSKKYGYVIDKYGIHWNFNLS